GLLRVIQRVVANGAERRDHRVADVLLDQPAVRADVGRDEIPDGPHALVELLRSEALGERGEARDVREQDGDLTGLTRATIGLCAEARAALTAEREAGRHLGATAGAARGELDAALTAEPHAGRVAVAAGSAQHRLREG